ncbi:MAG: carbon-nitrogen hydrolase family protein [Deltaproteobacteria bacterium]|nr:carbon-nitrogen hydrolase family protein [Deltaproteobacteria bacterium]
MKIALLQMSFGSDMAENLEKALSMMAEASAKGAQIVSFPELQLSPFFFFFSGRDMSQYAICIDHKIIETLRKKCRDLQLIGLPNIYLQEGDKCFDASPVIDSNGEILGISKMVHIMQAPQFYEQDYYTPSDTGFQVHDTAAGPFGIVVCFDRHLPESVRTCTLKGAQLIVIPTANTKGEPSELFEWELRVQAMQNGVFIAMTNRVGIEDQMHFCGESIVVDPNGDVVVKADDTEQIVYADVDLSLIERIRTARPYLKLRRPEAYNVITEQ